MSWKYAHGSDRCRTVVASSRRVWNRNEFDCWLSFLSMIDGFCSSLTSTIASHLPRLSDSVWCHRYSPCLLLPPSSHWFWLEEAWSLLEPAETERLVGWFALWTMHRSFRCFADVDSTLAGEYWWVSRAPDVAVEDWIEALGETHRHHHLENCSASLVRWRLRQEGFLLHRSSLGEVDWFSVFHPKVAELFSARN